MMGAVEAFSTTTKMTAADEEWSVDSANATVYCELDGISISENGNPIIPLRAPSDI